MSVRVQSLVWAMRGLKSSEKFVLIYLADKGNDEGEGIYPAVDTIAARTEMARATVFGILEKLKSKGLLAKTGATDRGVVIYRLAVEKLSLPVQNLDPPRPESGPKPSINHQEEPSRKICVSRKEKNAALDAYANDILSHVNQVSGRKWAIANDIRARLRWMTETSTVTHPDTGERFTPESASEVLKLIYDHRTSEWKGTEFEKFLDVTTPFRKSHYEKYLLAAIAWRDKGRPARIQKDDAKPDWKDL